MDDKGNWMCSLIVPGLHTNIIGSLTISGFFMLMSV